ncbi:glycosyltransferase [Janibacter cremeus]|uniref:Poly(Glycerol-phosphate) alpha-glucosyltransferase n=1 Tax=Janibacter cremeus TaxID=1285192 RepID=A0A852VTJ8_9MICO|nr:glycosyltransferase [Janibacter cremeus]NYF97983.1 poly(glycerol-phosphate) alpha-glucosyltransferase [Janibacter cremeus]
MPSGRRSLLSLVAGVRKRGRKPVSTPPAPTGEFPEGRYFATLGELPKNYRGTAAVVLHRSCMIAAQTGQPLEILTFGHQVDYDALTRQMRADGRLTTQVRFRNMWSDLARLHPHDPDRSGPTFDAFAPLDDRTTSKTFRGKGVPHRRLRQDEAGRNLQIDFLRADGTVIVSDRRDAPSTSGMHRSLVLCDTQSRPVAEFPSPEALHRYWLDSVIGADQAFVFSDTFGLAGLMHTYKRPNVVTVHTFHNHHLASGSARRLDTSQRRYLPFMDNVDDFDATIILSERQREDLDALLGPSPTRWVIPNSRNVDPPTPAPARDANAVMMVGGLVPGKQTEHGIRAVHQANQQLPEPLTLRIYGAGGCHDDLQALIVDLGARTITLAGFDRTAPDRFAQASFSLLTSRTESSSLVLLESMARGCIPIAYDVRYGPRELITDGVDGFLVPQDDIEALARTLVRVRDMGESELATLRENAARRAQDFSDASIGPRWAAMLRATLAAKVPPQPLALSDVTSDVTVDPQGLAVTMHMTTDRPLQRPRVHLSIAGRSAPVRMRRPATPVDGTGLGLRVRAIIGHEHLEWVRTTFLDAHLEVHDAAGRACVRLPAPASLVEDGAQTFAGFDVYATKHGNLSLKKEPGAGAPV